MDWASLSPLAIFTALKTAPKQVAGPWVPERRQDGKFRWPPCRLTPDGTTVVWEYNGTVTIHAHAFRHRVVDPKPLECSSRSEADAVLRSYGWILAEEAS